MHRFWPVHFYFMALLPFLLPDQPYGLNSFRCYQSQEITAGTEIFHIIQ